MNARFVRVVLLGELLVLASTHAFATGAQEQAAASTPEVIEMPIFAGGHYSVPAGDPIWEENLVGKMIEEDTGIRIIVDNPVGDADEKLNLRLASGDYPPMFKTGNIQLVEKAIREGIAVELDALLEEHGPNIKKAYGGSFEPLRWDDGRVYYTGGSGALPEGYQGPPHGTGEGGITIRSDVYRALGEPKLETIEDFYRILKEIDGRPEYDETVHGEKIWPSGAFFQTWQNIRDSLGNAAGFYDGGKWYVNNGEVGYWVRGPQAYTIAEYLNRLYREGLIDPDYVTIDRSTWYEKMANGRILAAHNPWWMNWNIHVDLEEAGIGDADDLQFLQFPVRVPGGQRPAYVAVNELGGKWKVITTANEYPEESVKLLDYLARPEIAFQTLNGVEGGVWYWENSRPTLKQEVIDAFNSGVGDGEFNLPWGYRLYHELSINNANDVPTPWDTFWILKDDPAVTGNMRMLERDNKFKDYWYPVRPFREMMKGMPEDISNIWTRVNEMTLNDFYVVVTSETKDQFVARWDEYVSGLERVGLARLEEFVNANFEGL